MGDYMSTKKRKFRIKIGGEGTYNPEGSGTNDLNQVIGSFLFKTGNDLGDKTVLQALHDHLTANNPYISKSSFDFERFESFGNDVDPVDVDTFK
jgi:hypothetical protein